MLVLFAIRFIAQLFRDSATKIVWKSPERLILCKNTGLSIGAQLPGGAAVFLYI